MKRIILILIALSLCFSMISTISAVEFKFNDVKESDWFYNDVKSSVEMGLINGKSPTTYAPNDNLTYAEAIKLAACINQLYNEGMINIPGGTPWYQPYVEYCIENDIIDKEYNYSETAKRYGFIEIFAKALPDECLEPINNVPENSIPDVQSSAFYSDAVYKLYRAGIVSGVDKTRKCDPHSNIKRSEVAAIINRMMNEEKRVRFDMDDVIKEAEEAQNQELTVISQTAFLSITAGEEAELNVAVSGGKAPYTYQWFNDDTKLKDNKKIKGATTDTIKIFEDVAGTSYNVTCKITDADGETIYSETVEFSFEKAPVEEAEIIYPLTIKTQPADMKVEVGETAHLTLEVEGGKAPYKYQWRTVIVRDGETMYMPLTDEANKTTDEKTSTIYLKPPVSTKFTLSCLVTDAEGEQIRSNSAAVTFGTPPETETPFEAEIEAVSKSFDEEKSRTEAVLKVNVRGGKSPYTYKWENTKPVGRGIEFEWIKVSEGMDHDSNQTFTGANTDELTIDSYTNEIVFRCTVTDSDGKEATSSHIYVAPVSKGVKIEEKIEEKIEDETEQALQVKYGRGGITSDGWYTKKIEVTGGTAPYTYQWQGINTRKETKYKDWQSFTVIAESIKSMAEDIFGAFGGLFSSADSVRAQIRRSEKTTEAWYPIKNISDDLADKAAIRCIITDAEGETIISEPFYLESSISSYEKIREKKANK